MRTDPTTAVFAPTQTATIWSKPFALTWVSTWLIFVGFYFLLPTLPGYLLSIGGKPSEVGWLMGIFTFSSMLFRPLGGRLADTRGKPRTMLLGGVLLAATMVFYWLAKTPATLLTLRFFHAIGWGIYLTAAVALISDVAHPTQRAAVTGHYFLANTLAMIGGPWLGILILKHSSYPVLFGASVGLTSLAILTIWPLHRATAAPAATTNGKWISRQAIFPALVLMLAAFTYGGIVSFLPLYAEHSHVANVGIFFAVYAVSLGSSRPLGGILADRLGRHVVILPGLLLMTVSMATLAWMPSVAGFVVVAVMYGIAFGAVGPALNAFTIDRVAPGERGAAMGVYAAAFELGLALGSVILGLILDHASFATMWLVAALSPLAGCALFAVGRHRQNN